MKKYFFLIIIMLTSNYLMSQSPGGVSNGLRGWFKADQLTGADGSTVTTWSSSGGASMTMNAPNTLKPTLYKTNSRYLINFNPTVRFNGTYNTNIMVSSSTYAVNPGSIFAGIKMFNNNLNGKFGYEGTMDYNGMHLNSVGGNIVWLLYNSSLNSTVPIQDSDVNVAGGVWTNSPSNNRLISVNGIVNTNTLAPITGTFNYRIGSDNNWSTGAYDDLYGDNIVYSNALSDADRIKVETYLAIKYGATLGKGTAFNYVNSSNTVIWTGNAAYQNYIAGIGRDDNSALYQKQSMSQNPDDQVIIGIGGVVAGTNAANTNSLVNGQFLIWGDNGLPRELSVNIAGISDVTRRFQTIWKVQNTGNVGTVRIMWPAGVRNLKLIQSSDANFDSTDVITSMYTNTQTVNGVLYNYADVTFSNGQYFSFVGIPDAPGGVVGHDFWVKSDDAGTPSIAWKDQSRNKNPIENVGGISMMPADAAHNFHSYSTGYTTTKFFRDNATKLAANNAYTQYSMAIFSSVRPTSLADGRITGIDNENTTIAAPHISIKSTGVTRFYKVVSVAESLDGLASAIANQSCLKYFRGSNVSKELVVGHDGTENSKTISGTFGTWGPYHNIGYGTWDNGGAFPGDIMEVIWYNRALTVNESDMINSYLAIKNGVTFAKNYLSANNTTVWNRAVNGSFNNNIFGIATDYTGNLNQLVSNSANLNSNLKVSTINNFIKSNEDTSRTPLKHNQYLLIGDNNSQTGTTSVNPVDCPVFSDGVVRLNKTWMTQETNSVGSVFVEVDLSSYYMNSDIVMYLSDNASFTSNTTIVQPVSITGYKAVFNVDFKANQYFTFVGKINEPVCATCFGGTLTVKQAKGWSSASNRTNDSTGWITIGTDGQGTAIQAKSKVIYSNPATQWIDAWMPWPYGSSALLAHAGTVNGTAGKMTYTTELNRAAKASFDLTGINEWYGNKVKVVVRGYCGTAMISPKITQKVTGPWAVYNSYTISGNTISGNKYYMGLSNFAKVKVAFSRPVERVEVDVYVDRSPTYYTHFWFMVGDMALECASPIEPNKDNIYVKQSSIPDTIAACNTATIKMNIKNLNCSSRVVNLSNTLPAGLSYVAGSFTSDDSLAKPIYAGSTFTLNNYTMKPGETNLFVEVASTNSSSVTTTTKYQTQSTYNATVASGGTGTTLYSDNMSALPGNQKTDLTLKPAVKPTMPIVEFTSQGAQDSCGVINYTIKIDNTNVGTTMSNLVLQPFLSPGQTINSSLTLSSGLSGTSVPSPISGGTSFMIPDLKLNSVGVHTITFSTQVNQIDETAKNSVELYIDPATNECALSAKVIAKLNESCALCEGGSAFFDMNKAWYNAGASGRTTNALSNIAIGNPMSGPIKTDVTVTYPNSTTEWLPTFFPRSFGKFTELSRYDNLHAAAGVVKYVIKLKDSANNPIAATPSFQVAGMTDIWKQKDIVKITGYCGIKEVKPKLYADNGFLPNIYNRQANTGNVSTGVYPFFDYYTYATNNVEFEKPVDRIEIEWSVDRSTYVFKTLGFLYIGDLNFNCVNRPEPNADNVFLITSFNNDSLPTCDNGQMKINVKNWNCTTKQIDIASSLPSGLSFVPNSFVASVGSDTAVLNSGSFTMNNFKAPPGNSYLFVKVKSTANTTASYDTKYTYTLDTGLNSPNPYSSDGSLSMSGFQFSRINYKSSTVLSPAPTLAITSNKKCFELGSNDTILYTMTFNNNTSAPLTNVTLNNPMGEGLLYLKGLSSSPFGGTVDLSDSLGIYISNMTIPVGASSLSYFALVSGNVKKVQNNASFIIDPSSECAISSSVQSNVLSIDTAFYYNGLTTGIPKKSNVGITSFDKHSNIGWPMNVENAWLTLDSKTKGFVITRTTSSSITSPVEGMILYDTTDKCFKLYNGTIWKCIQRQCTE